MRNPDRIDKFCMELAEKWKTNVPDWRFGQLICNVIGSMQRDPWFPEDDEMMQFFRDYFKDYKRKEESRNGSKNADV